MARSRSPVRARRNRPPSVAVDRFGLRTTAPMPHARGGEVLPLGGRPRAGRRRLPARGRLVDDDPVRSSINARAPNAYGYFSRPPSAMTSSRSARPCAHPTRCAIATHRPTAIVDDGCRRSSAPYRSTTRRQSVAARFGALCVFGRDRGLQRHRSIPVCGARGDRGPQLRETLVDHRPIPPAAVDVGQHHLRSVVVQPSGRTGPGQQDERRAVRGTRRPVAAGSTAPWPGTAHDRRDRHRPDASPDPAVCPIVKAR